MLWGRSPKQLKCQDALIDKIVPVELTRAHLTDSKPISTGFVRDLSLCWDIQVTLRWSICANYRHYRPYQTIEQSRSTIDPRTRSTTRSAPETSDGWDGTGGAADDICHRASACIGCTCPAPMSQWTGLRENLQETMVSTIKYRGFL